jgi:hypothetical protein
MDRINTSINHLQRLMPLSRSQGFDLTGAFNTFGMGDIDGSIFPIHNIPPSKTRIFIGRTRSLSEIEDYFESQSASSSPEPLKVLSVWGLGGIGKTELALTYSRNARARYDAIFTIVSDSLESLEQGFSQIATDLQLPGAKQTGDHQVHAYNLSLVKRWLRHTGQYIN